MRYQEGPTRDLCREFPQEEGELAQILSKEKPVTHILLCNFSTSKTLGGEKWSKQTDKASLCFEAKCAVTFTV